MHTILGAGGVIGTETAKALDAYTQSIRLVSRNPQKVNEQDELVKADLRYSEDVIKAVKGSEVVYLTAGLPYSHKTWQRDWPAIMHNVIEACGKEGARLVFFDNVYMYDSDNLGEMTEDTPFHPISKKGMVREQITNMLIEAVEKGKLTAAIARSADFYGPGIKKVSVLTESVFKRLAADTSAFWFMAVDKKHSFTYTPDAGKAMAMLGNTPDAFNRTWHMPTAPNPFTGQEWITEIARELHVKSKFFVGNKLLIKAMGWVDPILRESAEMLYQYDRDYIFNSATFEKRFNFTPTPYNKGIEEVVKRDYAAYVGLALAGT
jgi:nucleoside-diphosphate-sugar epimerase